MARRTDGHGCCVRLLIRSLDDIKPAGRPNFLPMPFRPGWDGRTEVPVLPGDAYDKLLASGFTT